MTLDLITRRLRTVEDDLAIRDLCARFSDAVNERDLAAFARLWTLHAVWEVGAPAPMRAHGIDAIVEMLRRVLSTKPSFVQMTHSAVIDFDSIDAASVRVGEREFGRLTVGPYQNLAVYDDRVVRTSGGWRFDKRVYRYRHLDESLEPGRVFPISAGPQGVLAPSRFGES